jgi:hypothetical protein
MSVIKDVLTNVIGNPSVHASVQFKHGQTPKIPRTSYFGPFPSVGLVYIHRPPKPNSDPGIILESPPIFAQRPFILSHPTTFRTFKFAPRARLLVVQRR